MSPPASLTAGPPPLPHTGRAPPRSATPPDSLFGIHAGHVSGDPAASGERARSEEQRRPDPPSGSSADAGVRRGSGGSSFSPVPSQAAASALSSSTQNGCQPRTRKQGNLSPRRVYMVGGRRRGTLGKRVLSHVSYPCILPEPLTGRNSPSRRPPRLSGACAVSSLSFLSSVDSALLSRQWIG